ASRTVPLATRPEEGRDERSATGITFQRHTEAAPAREKGHRAQPAPGTAAAIEVTNGICPHRSALEGMAAISFQESQHGSPEGVAARVYRAYREFYGFSEAAAETYAVHADQDVGHGGRQSAASRK